MRLHILSDLHLEFAPASIPATDADVIVLAGDIDQGHSGLGWVRHWFADRPVVYVLGNHEFYRHALPKLTEELQAETSGSCIHVLENRAVDLGGFTFLGCTLWTNFLAGGNQAAAFHAANQLMNDFRIVRNSRENRPLRAQDTARLHAESVAWLRSQLATHDPQRTIVVTHHAPSLRSEEPIYQGGVMSPAFVSALDGMVEASGVPLWVHGHTHYNVDYRLGATRVVSNQCGYPSQPCQGFDPAMVVEV